MRQNNELSRFCLTMMSDIVLSSERPVDSKFSEKSEVMPILARRSYCGVWSLAAPTCQDPPGLERPSADPLSTSRQPHVCLISSQLPLRLSSHRPADWNYPHKFHSISSNSTPSEHSATLSSLHSP